MTKTQRSRLWNARYRLATYNLTAETAAKLLDQQQWRCPICGVRLQDGHFAEQDGRTVVAPDPEDAPRTKGRRNAATIDHCHRTGRVRGVLCARCNAAIGMFEEDPTVIKGALRYLRATSKTDHRDPELVALAAFRRRTGTRRYTRRGAP
jgi:hypothetical protein